MKRLKFVSLLSCIVFLSGCTWTQALWVGKEVVEHYPEDNPIEEWVETKVGIDDLTPWSPEEE